MRTVPVCPLHKLPSSTKEGWAVLCLEHPHKSCFTLPHKPLCPIKRSRRATGPQVGNKLTLLQGKYRTPSASSPGWIHMEFLVISLERPKHMRNHPICLTHLLPGNKVMNHRTSSSLFKLGVTEPVPERLCSAL